MKLELLGYNEFFKGQVNDQELVGRVSTYAQNIFSLYTEEGKIMASLSGKMLFEQERPMIGDYVIYTKSEDGTNYRIKRILSRASALTRKEAGNRSDGQIIAANMEYLFIVMSLNEDFNLRRLERYMVGAWESGATPVIILTKADLIEDYESLVEEVENVTYGVKTIAISALKGINLEELEIYNQPGKTIALVGSSGVGKSTLINTLAGKEIMKTDGLRNDDRGHHTTTHREMILTDYAVLIDTPGMREFGVLGDEASVDQEFADVYELSKKCKYHDCKHGKEPGCAVKTAIDRGDLDESRLSSYNQLKREIRFQNRKLKRQEKAMQKQSDKKNRKNRPRQKNWSSANY